MFRKLTIATAVLASGIAVAAPGADAAVNKCKARGTTTLAMSGQSRAYDQNGTVFACLKRTGERRALEGVIAGTDVVKVAGKFVAYSSAPEAGDGARSQVNVERIADGASPEFLPSDTGGQVANIALKPNGAAAWAVTPLDDPAMSYVQGTDRSNHTPDLLSDDQTGVDTASLTSAPGARVSWTYTNGTTGQADLFTGPAELF